MDNGHVIAPASYERALLLEAVTLLTQSQADTESALSEQLAHTTRRMAVLEQRCDDFESRLTRIDERLARIAVDLQPPPDPDLEQRLNLLKTQVERLSGRTHTPTTGTVNLGSTGWLSPLGPAGSAPAPTSPASPGSTPLGPRVSFGPTGPHSPAGPHSSVVAPAPVNAVGTPGSVNAVHTPGPITAGSTPGPVTSPTPVGSASPAPTGGPVNQPVPAPPNASNAPPPSAQVAPPTRRQTQRQSASTALSSSNVWDYLGATPQDRAAIVLVGLGLVAVVYAVLVQLHFG